MLQLKKAVTTQLNALLAKELISTIKIIMG